MATCYRHPSRETGVSCSNCGKPICPDCMTPTPVGMRCPDCAGQKQRVQSMRSLHVDPIVTYVLIGINVLLFLGSGAGGSFLTGSGGSSRVFQDLALWGPAIDLGHDYWRLVTAGFLHSGLLHIGFNMYILYWLGTMLEPSLGHARFLALYLASLLAGSFGALLVSPNAVTVGASGAVFGLMGAAFVMQRARGMDPMQSGIGPVILFNLVLSFVIPNISIGGHIGGLVGGAAAAFAMERLAGRRPGIAAPIAACVAVGAIAVVAAIAVSGRNSPFTG
ncbi:MAG TPA: rhomboid family intramembrane serine protease [Solirubrobacteraceae bacterium]|nr:rhomboid family intramembrane serine protease [Solirubrobacteraceae bacterium]